MLNKLIDALLRIIAQNTQHQIIDRKKSLERLKNQKYVDLMVKVIVKQKAFVSKIHELRLTLEDQGGAPHPGVIYDHIAALKGPISRFYQALQHGLILSISLYQQMKLKFHLQYQLEDSLVKTDHPLQNFNELKEQRLFKSGLENTNLVRLEERASTKRLSNFFNH